MEKDKRKEVRRDIKASTIPEELKVMYLLADALEIMSRRSFRRIKAVYARHGYALKENTMLTGLNGYCKFIKMATHQFFERVDPHIINATYGAAETETDDAVALMDSFNRDANEIVRLVMLYIDRTARDGGGAAEVFATLRRMPGLGLFSDEDIAGYKFGG